MGCRLADNRFQLANTAEWLPNFFCKKSRFVPTMAVFNPRAVVTSGLSTNSNGGAYHSENTYDIIKKFELVDTYDELHILAVGVPPSSRVLAAAVNVSHV
jgi:hypothetical protein